MVSPNSLLRGLIAAGGFALAAVAQPLLPPEQIDLGSLGAFQPTTPNWQIAAGIAGDPRAQRAFETVAGSGVLVNLPRDEAKGPLLTTWEHGDLELEVEFLLPSRSNSGIYFQGRYELQLRDSWEARELTFGDCGGIYQRWDPARGEGREGFDGHAPRANACRAPGLWQRLRVEFEAPRFDAAGRRTKPARFAKVLLNGFLIHENVELTGPTQGALGNDERATGPLLVQGDHGPIALRGLKVKRFGSERVAVEGVRYKYYRGEFEQLGDYDSATPTTAGALAQFAAGQVEKSGRFALVFTGTLVVPTAGEYAFSTESSSITRLLIGDRLVTVPLDRNSAPGVVTLPAGRHSFRLDMLHRSSNRANLELITEGPRMPPHPLTVREAGPEAARGPRQIVLDPKEQALVQRGFVPFEPRKRLYAVNVGTPQGVHYSYDTETGALLRGWSGKYLDVSEMWDGRGHNQIAKPRGPALTLSGKPNFALIEYPLHSGWPDQPEALWAARGYEVGADGLPVFLATLARVELRDRIAPAPEGRGLVRTIESSLGDDERLPEWSLWILIAEADTITPQPDGRGWIVGDREWYVDTPVGAAAQPVVRRRSNGQQLAVPLTRATVGKPITYTLVW